MARKTKGESASNWTILLAEDDPDYAQTTVTLLEREGHTVVWADSGAKALEVLRSRQIDLLLLDYFMPGMTGEETVIELRKFNTNVQVILQTGYASEQPPRALLKRLDIQGYHDKSEGPEKLLMWTDVGLKAAYAVQLLRNSREGLRFILNATPELHKIQPLNELLQGIILQISGLLGNVNSFLAINTHGNGVQIPEEPKSEGFLAMLVDETELAIQASTGRFHGFKSAMECLNEQELSNVRTTVQQNEIRAVDGTTIVPLCVGPAVIGVVYLDRAVSLSRDLELLQVFANQAAVAIHNSQLYEMATLDPLTGVYVRRFFEQWLLRELRAAFRKKYTLSILMVDMDKLKQINDTMGHLGGDGALAAMGSVLRRVLRDTDICGRYGGDEFAIVLHEPGPQGGELLAERILELLRSESVEGPNGRWSVAGSIGVSLLEAHDFDVADIPKPIPAAYFDDMAKQLIDAADRALYKAKHTGGSCAFSSEPLQWKAFS
ncbi:diguanylate cyclase [Uliginosibacterium sp. H3]|uniref:diguanylate cyclase n=1 Tax=Uliginosibacterium silvisoli TaxID=3114758 RepID=A0ABU6K7N6_9RHOO|nr:diguanylate cyclase [Uliginosibacterium sp. H3]